MTRWGFKIVSNQCAHANDIYGMQMAPTALTLPDDQAVSDVVADILSLN